MWAKTVNGINRVFKFIGSIAMFASMLLICADVFMRYVFNAPISGTLELTELMPVLVTYCYFTYTGMIDRHIRATFMVERMSDKTKFYANLVAQILMFGLLTVIVWRTAAEASYSWHIREIKQGLIEIPQYPIKVFIPIGLALGWFYYLGQIIGMFKPAKHNG